MKVEKRVRHGNSKAKVNKKRKKSKQINTLLHND